MISTFFLSSIANFWQLDGSAASDFADLGLGERTAVSSATS
jgi:hypothetical protein